MLHQHTLHQLKALRRDGMARAFEEQLTLPIAAELAFEDRFAQLVDRELHWRDNQRRDRLLKQAKLKHPQACLEDLARIDVLILDDWGLTPLDQSARHDLLEVIDDRIHDRATIITSQLPNEHWHAWLNDPTLADAFLDRLVHQSYRLNLKGESLRKIDRQNTPNEHRS